MTLDDGTLLLAAAMDNHREWGGVQRYDPDAWRWTKLTATLLRRFGYTATALDDRRMLLAGGLPDTNLPSGAGRLPPRYGTRLGMASRLAPPNDPADLRIGEIVDASSREVSGTGPMVAERRWGHVAERLPSGGVLVAGGFDAQGQRLATSEVYDPTTNRWRPAQSMSQPRGYASSVVLPDGRVMVIGGSSRKTSA